MKTEGLQRLQHPDICTDDANKFLCTISRKEKTYFPGPNMQVFLKRECKLQAQEEVANLRAQSSPSFKVKLDSVSAENLLGMDINEAMEEMEGRCALSLQASMTALSDSYDGLNCNVDDMNRQLSCRS